MMTVNLPTWLYLPWPYLMWMLGFCAVLLYVITDIWPVLFCTMYLTWYAHTITGYRDRAKLRREAGCPFKRRIDD